MKIVIEAIPMSVMRYGTLGDWFKKNDTLHIQVADHVSKDEQWLIALHEMVEAHFCERDGVTEGDVDAFDFTYTGQGEPGDDPKAPYRVQHRKAMIIEHMAAQMLGLDAYGTIE